MPSPFPGMDPWLERPAVFPDLHDRLIAALGAAINAQLPPPYFSAIANRIWIEGPERHVEPDVDILRPPLANGSTNGGVAVASAVNANPVIVSVPGNEVIERHLEIHSAPDGEHLVTSIEILSLSNKRQGSQGRREYRRKQRQIRRSRVNLVEIDLLRGGKHTTAVPLRQAIKKAGAFDYHVCVHRFNKPDDYEVYPIQLPRPLPAIAIPLLPNAADIVVNLQALLAQCYDSGLYARRVRYGDQVPEPPLLDEQSQWANRLLREKALVA